MNIQIFGSSKCFDTKKAERWFKERRVKYQYIDLPKKGFSAGEYRAVRQKQRMTAKLLPDRRFLSAARQ